jgi:hypothetical protein
MKTQIISILIFLLLFVACTDSESKKPLRERITVRQNQPVVQTETIAAGFTHLIGEWEYIETFSLSEDGTETIEIIDEFHTYLHPTLIIDRDGSMRARFYASFIGELVETETNLFSFENVIWQSEGEEGDHHYPIFLEYFPQTETIRYHRDSLVDYFIRKPHIRTEVELYLHTGSYKNHSVNIEGINFRDADSPDYHHLVFSANQTIYDFSYLAIEADISADEQIIFNKTKNMFSISKLTAYHEFIVNWIGLGTFPHRAISFVETDGTKRLYAINLNNADPEEDPRGPVFLTEITVN